jgi:tRNA(fMet)-specific endonuclease VapC
LSFVLDTNVCIAYLDGQDHAVRDRMLGMIPSQLKLTSVVKAELLYGARNSDRVEANLARLARFFEPFVSLPFDDAAAEWYGVIRAQLRREGTPIGANDLMIAAVARAVDGTLVTRNQDEFRRVAGLKIACW